MKVLVDTSVWSLALRRKLTKDHKKVTLLYDLIESDQPIYLMGVIVQELLQHIRENAQFNKIKLFFKPFPLLEPSYETYIAAAQIASSCRRHGIQASTIDALIAATAVEYDCQLLTTDLDFEHIATKAPLKLI